jgi:hypothetical protein
MDAVSSLHFLRVRSRTALVALVVALCLAAALLGFAGSQIAGSRGHTPDEQLMAPFRWYKAASRTA